MNNIQFNVIDDHFPQQHHQMQKTRNNCFGFVKTSHRRAKTGKYECEQ